DTVDGDVELAALEPACRAGSQIGVADGVPGLLPSQKGAGLLAPEALGISERLLVKLLIAVGINVRGGCQCRRYRMIGDRVHRPAPSLSWLDRPKLTQTQRE